MRLIARLFALFALPLAVAAGTQSSSINVVEVADLSGPNSDTGKDFVTGARVYFDQLNARGGINGRHVNLIVEDDKGEPASTVSISKQLVAQNHPVALFGYFGEDNVRAVTADPTLNSLPLVAPYIGIDMPTGSNVFYLRAGMTSEVKKIAQIAQSAGLSKIAIFTGSDALGRAARNEVPKLLENMKLSVTIQPNAGDPDKAAEQVARVNPQAIILAAPTLESAQFVKAYQTLRSGVQFFAMSWVNPQTVREFLGPEGVRWVGVSTVVPSPYNATTPIAREFIAALSKFRDEPPTFASMEGYMSARLLAENLRSKDAASLGKALGDYAADWGGVQVSLRNGRRGLQSVDLSVFSSGGGLLN
ncbi:MAG: ABC transporter substrate-binding protein [Burkholderiales bacterium]|nr:ABC transporter substrate-binding protein [Burkholderiales bacterium]